MSDKTNMPLVLAIPSKGRLQENTNHFFARAGLVFKQSRGERDYRGTIAGLPDVEVAYLSASEIAAELASGGAHLGITGEDLIRENIEDAAERLVLLTPLGFGHANVVVAVPQAWIDVSRMTDLEDAAARFRQRHGRKMRVATKYVNLTRRFFSQHGISDYRIVDLVASVVAPWNERQRQAVASILRRIAAEEEARTTREVRADLSAFTQSQREDVCQRFDARPVGSMSDRTVVFQCPVPQLFALTDHLLALGAERIAVSQRDYIFRPANPLLDVLEARIGPS